MDGQDGILATGAMALVTLAAFGACAYGARSAPADQRITKFVLWAAAAFCIPVMGHLLLANLLHLRAERTEQLRRELPERVRLLCEGGGARTDRIVLCMEIDRLKGELSAAGKEERR